MGFVARALAVIVDVVLWPFDRLPATLGLTAFAAATGLAMLLVVARCTPQRRLRRARARMSSAVYEVRLFLDSPRRVLAAQGRLLAWSALYLAYLLPAFVLLLPVLALFYGPLEARHGLRALRAGESALVRIELARTEAGTAAESVEAELPPGVKLSAPPVFVPASQALYLRLRVDWGGHHELRLTAPGWSVAKRLSALATPVVLAERRAGFGNLLAVGSEPALPSDGPVRAIAISHAQAAQRWLGLPLPWWGHWVLVATLVALALRKRFNVAL